MDPAVALVDAYLQINGYFTVLEYPVVAATVQGRYEELTDIDVLAFRFASAGRHIPHSPERNHVGLLQPDPVLGVDPDSPDMLVVEVKQGRAALNAPARRRDVLMAALVRFGCCEEDEAAQVVAQLRRAGHARTCSGHTARTVVFGAAQRQVTGAERTITIPHVVGYLAAHLRNNQSMYRAAQFRHPALALMLTIMKSGYLRTESQERRRS